MTNHHTPTDAGAPAPFEVKLTHPHDGGETITTTLLTTGRVPFPTSPCAYQFARPQREPYHIAITEADEYLVLVLPFDGNKPGARFTHPNIVRTRNKKLEYKHYRADGSKYWTSKLGVEQVLVVPRALVQLNINPTDPGYSYVPVIINNAEVTLNVSGGTANGWTDWVNTVCSACSNHPLKTLKAIAAVAVRGTHHEPFVFWDERTAAHA